MGANKIDQIFKHHLDRHEEAVSMDAFSQIQQNLNAKKKQNRKGYLMIAASLSLIMVFSSLFIFKNMNSENSNLLSLQNIPSSNAFASNALTIPTVKDNKAQINNLNTTKTERLKAKEQSKKVIKTQKKKEEYTPQTLDFNRPESIQALAAIAPIKEAEKLNIPMREELSIIETESFIKVNLQYNEVIASKAQESEKSGLEQFVNKNNSKLKELASEYSLAELRSAKNDLFASALQFNKKATN